MKNATPSLEPHPNLTGKKQFKTLAIQSNEICCQRSFRGLHSQHISRLFFACILLLLLFFVFFVHTNYSHTHCKSHFLNYTKHSRSKHHTVDRENKIKAHFETHWTFISSHVYFAVIILFAKARAFSSHTCPFTCCGFTCIFYDLYCLSCGVKKWEKSIILPYISHRIDCNGWGEMDQGWTKNWRLKYYLSDSLKYSNQWRVRAQKTPLQSKSRVSHDCIALAVSREQERREFTIKINRSW